MQKKPVVVSESRTAGVISSAVAPAARALRVWDMTPSQGPAPTAMPRLTRSWYLGGGPPLRHFFPRSSK